jgi:hypothetical protein
MEAGLSDHVWSIKEFVDSLEAALAIVLGLLAVCLIGFVVIECLRLLIIHNAGGY